MIVILLACVATGALVYPTLPAMVASHWGAGGQVNGTMSKLWGVALLPIIMLVCIILWAVVPKIDPLAPSMKGFRYVYDFIFFLIVAFFAYVYALTLLANLGIHFNMTTALLPALAALIAILGALLPRLKRNWFVGIRTPWTISSDRVWNKTHLLGRTLFEVAALCILAAAFTPPPLALALSIIPLLAAVIICVAYSYIVFRQQR